MTNATQPKPNPLPAILVYGTPSGPALTQASWFRAEDKEAVKAAAKELKFSVIELHTDADRALAAGAHEGVLKGSGRMIVGSVSAEVYRRIEEHVRKGAGAPDPSQPDDAAAATTQIRVRTKQEPDRSRPIGDRQTRPRQCAQSLGGVAGRREGSGRLLEREARVRGLLARDRQADRERRVHPRVVRGARIPGLQERGRTTSPSCTPSSASRASSARMSVATIIIFHAWGGLRVAPLLPRMPNRRAPSQPQPQETEAMTSTTVTTAERIRALNDAFRRTFVGGAVMITAGVEAMPLEQRRSLLQKVRAFDAFTDDNDPHGEHDFGAIDEGGVRCFWKIDCYDRATEFGSPDPTDPAVTTRVLTIMRADEY